MVEMDSYAHHRHRAAFERDRARDAKFAAAGYRVIRLTHRRLEEEPGAVADQLRRLLGLRAEWGQGTVEWVGLLLLTSLVFLSLVAAGVRVPGLSVAQAVASRILCAATIADSCGDEPGLIAAYGSEVGAIAREDMPSLAFEHGSRGLPVDFRSCRDTSCGDGPDSGLVARTDAGLPVTAFVHVIDCREGGERPVGADCSGEAAGNLYVQYWTYYADSATLRGVPIAGAKGFHRDDWESVQLRIGPDGEVAERASSHHGYNYAKGPGQRRIGRRNRGPAGDRRNGRRPAAQRLGPGQRAPVRLRRQSRRERRRLPHDRPAHARAPGSTSSRSSRSPPKPIRGSRSALPGTSGSGSTPRRARPTEDRQPSL